MRYGRNVWRRSLLKANQARLRKIQKEIEFKDLLIKFHKRYLVLRNAGDYCSALEVELQSELTNHDGKREEYCQLMIDLPRRRSGPNPNASSHRSILHDYHLAVHRADIFCNKVKEGIASKNAEFEKIKGMIQLGQNDQLKRRTKADPVGLEKQLEQAIAKTEEIKSNLDSLKLQWDAVKDDLNGGIDSCIQDVIALEVVGHKEE
ncbi:unnamed protein product [Orchesella dallaii]|uniref:Uncharacterized protein n=1 Tax=Orchesella dallaii TaxID=48710 RepID=A0ABP1QT94_9HEXA